MGLALGLASAAMGQQTTGTVRGAVVDPSRAVVPGATVELINQATNVTRSQVTGGTGDFVFNYVEPGPYTVKVSLAGFKTFVKKDVGVALSKVANVEAQLSLGETKELMEVIGRLADDIDTVSPQVVTNIDSKLILELPTLNQNSLGLAEINPGVTMDFSSTQNGTGQVMNIEGARANVSGTRNQRNAFYMDGGDNSNNFRNEGLQVPNPDAIQEISVATSNTGVEFGRQPGGAFNVITKSGTNRLSGSATYHFRTESLDANDWVRNRVGDTRPEDNFKMGNATLGGPIIKDRTFFFVSGMFYRDKASGFQNDWRVPTAAMQAGDFSAIPGLQLYNPDTRQPLPGNIIPPSLLDPIALKIQKQISTQPTYDGKQYRTFSNPTAQNELLAKVDHHINAAHTLTASYFMTKGDVTDFSNANNHFDGFGPLKILNKQIAASLRHTWVIGNNAVLETRGTYTRLDSNRQARTGAPLGELGAQNFPTATGGTGSYYPEMQVSPWNNGFYVWAGFTGHMIQENYTFGSSFTVVKGDHNIKVGGDLQKVRMRPKDDTEGQSINFYGAFSNGSDGTSQPGGDNQFAYSYADFLMGRLDSFGQAGRALGAYDLSDWNYHLYAQDQWRMSPRVTLTLGLRYELTTPMKEKNNRMSAYIAGLQSTSFPNAPLGLAFAGDPGVQAGFFDIQKDAVAPRLGFAWDLNGDGRTAVRAGFGKFYSSESSQMKMVAAEGDPWTPSAGGTRALLSNPWLTSRYPVYTAPPTPFTDATLRNFQWGRVGRAIAYADPWASAYYWQWNAAVERELIRGLNVSATYVGTRGRNLLSNVPINYALWSADADFGNVDQRRPNQLYYNINRFEPKGRSYFNAVQLAASVRRSGLTARLAYQLGKAADTSGTWDAGGGDPMVSNPANPYSDLELLEVLPRHTVRAYFVWELPFLRDRHSLAAKVLGGWQIAGNFQYRSGNHLDTSAGADWNLDGVAGDRLDAKGPINYTNQALPDGWFQYLALGANNAPFAQPGGPTPNPTWSTTQRGIVVGPSFWNADMALMKDFLITDRTRLQLRFEGYNVFNHPTLGNPILNFQDSRFGQINGKYGRRTVQLGARLSF